MIKRIKFLIAGYIVLLDTETSMIAYIMQPWNKKPLQWMKPTHLAYGCSSCDCRACRDGYNKDYGPCGRLLNEEFSFLPYDLNYSPQYDETYCSWKQALQDLCDKKGYTLYHHQLDGTSYQIHAGGISVNGYLSLAPNRNISDLKSMMYAYLYFALLNSPNYRQRMDTFYNFQCLELKEDKRKKY